MMPGFSPRPACAPYHFHIKRSRHGHWTVSDRGGLTGGTFVSRKDALRFALFRRAATAPMFICAARDHRATETLSDHGVHGAPVLIGLPKSFCRDDALVESFSG